MMDEHRGDYGGPDDFMSRGANERLDGWHSASTLHKEK
jgi:hypothetical protein